MNHEASMSDREQIPIPVPVLLELWEMVGSIGVSLARAGELGLRASYR
jgi:hypothetical protein